MECGGDADTVAAITGGIVAVGTGPGGTPAEWVRAGVFEAIVHDPREVLLRFEQESIVQKDYDELSNIAFAPTVMTIFVENPFNVVNGGPFTENRGQVVWKNLCNLDDRWDWIQREMVSKWYGNVVGGVDLQQWYREDLVGRPDSDLIADFPNG